MGSASNIMKLGHGYLCYKRNVSSLYSTPYTKYNGQYTRCIHCTLLRKYKEDFDKLGLPESATADQIKSAYFKKAKEFHPDSSSTGEKSEEAFIEITEAYKRLTYESKFSSRSPNFNTKDPRNNPREAAYWEIRRRRKSPEEIKREQESTQRREKLEKQFFRKILIGVLIGIFFGTIFPALFISEGEYNVVCACDQCLLRRIQSNPSTRHLLKKASAAHAARASLPEPPIPTA